jgi:hypothetical protein
MAGKLYGADRKVEGAEFIGELRSVYTDVEATAVREAERGDLSLRDKTAYRQLASLARSAGHARADVWNTPRVEQTHECIADRRSDSRRHPRGRADLDDPTLALLDPD